MTTSKSTGAGIYAACRLGLAMTALARRCVRLPAVGRVSRRTPSVPALQRGSVGGRGAYACPALPSHVDEVARPGDASRAAGTFTHLAEPGLSRVCTLHRPGASALPRRAHAARPVRQALADVGLDGAVRTCGAKGVQAFLPAVGGTSPEETAAATRAVAVRAEALEPDV